MLRPLLSLFLSLAPIAAGAQSIPDTTAPARYFPLSVGDVWEYERAGLIKGFQRRSVVGDTAVGGQDYFRYRVEYFETDGTPSGPADEILVRLDPASWSLVTPSANPLEIADLFVTTCPFDSDFFAELFDCPGSAVVLTSGGPETFYVGDDSVATTVKYFDDNSREIFGTYVAGIGFAGFLLRTGALTLAYASVGGQTYGAPIPVANEPQPAHGRPALAVRPNPAAGPVEVAADLVAAGPFTVEVFDALGRRVYSDVMARPAGRAQFEIAARGWRQGAYVVRLITGGEVSVARFVLR